MNNIKQKFTKFILSFVCLFAIGACESNPNSYNNGKNKQSSNVTEIAVLVPLSGSLEQIGKQYAGLIKMGLADGAKSKIRITVLDSANEEKLTESVQRILDSKINVVIGPVYSKDTKLVSSMVRGKEVIVLSLSNDPTLADNNVFVFGHAPMRQMEQITNYLLNNDYKHFVTLLPANRYSQTISKIIQNMITNKGGVLSKMEFYSPDEADTTKAVTVISDNVDNLNEQEENLKQPVVLVGDDSENLKKIYKIAKSLNLDKKAVIAGDNRLDIDTDEPINYISTGSIMMHSNNLKERATKLGVSHFSFMHALAYDAGKMVASYIGDGYNKEAFLAKLSGLEKFPGVSGNIGFVDSIAVRQYEIIKKYNGQYSILNDKEPSQLEQIKEIDDSKK